MSHLFDLEPEFVQLFDSCKSETMTSIERMYALYQATCHVLDRGIMGDFVECGVWRGGTGMLIAATPQAPGCTNRPILLYDTVCGMPPPSHHRAPERAGPPAPDHPAQH